ncbi:MAG: LysM peptidoglycan-binding domain-containing protein, partial [Chloroflexi bacterium]|nr:LysM peptidoglycan-binding domain-containing protein [Chloroflexota bacterium]
DIHGFVGLPNWEIRLKQDGGTDVRTALTNGVGFVRFGELMPGWYVLEEVMQDGWAPVSWTSQKVYLRPTADGSCASVTFYNRQSRGASYPVDPPASGCRYTHVVTCGQTLSSIAFRYGVSISQIMAANGLTNPNYIWVGQRLCIP